MATWWATVFSVTNSYVRLTEKGQEGQMPTDGVLVSLFSSVSLDYGQTTVERAKDAVKKFFKEEISDSFRLRVTEQFACKL